MGYPLSLAVRYLASKRGNAVSVGTLFSTLGVTLGVAALSIVMSVTGGFKEQFREKVLGVNAHVLVLKKSSEFRDYREVMKKVAEVPGVVAVAPFIINPMMVTHGARTATGVLLKGVDPELMPKVLDLPRHMLKGSLPLREMRRVGAKPAEKPEGSFFSPPRTDSLLRDLNSPKPDASAANSFDQMLQDEIRRDAERAAAKKTAQGVADAPRANGPSGDVTPKGGFDSKLPDDDELPSSVDPDPCKSPAEVAGLPGLVVGVTLAKQLSASIGDCVQITSPTVGISFGGAKPPIAKQFKVIGMFEAGFDQYDSKLVYTDLYEAEAFYDQGDSVTGVEMRVDDIDRASDIARTIERSMSSSYHTMDWQELNRSLFTALLLQQIAMSFVLALIIVVAAFTVIATLIMVVLDKRKEIALLKALGAKDGAILRIFLYQGGITGLTGTGLGLLLGFIGCHALAAYEFPLDPKVYFISKLPLDVRLPEFLSTGLIAIVICLLATIVPSLYAAWLRPSEGLRQD
jgi:lipoprotein-releasing system permease protein